MFVRRLRTLIVLAAAVCTAAFALPASADTFGQREFFFVNHRYDITARTSLSATLRQISVHGYFYVEDDYWNKLTVSQQTALTADFQTLASDFDSIYNKETAAFGEPSMPGIDNDPRVTILLENLAQGNGGYFDTVNLFPRSQAHNSNEREMLAVSIAVVGTDLARDFIAHEFQHLISFHQKEQLRDVSEDVWLNEVRSEYAVTVAGYNEPFSGSNLENRTRSFLRTPSDSLTEWPNTATDYGIAAVFGDYIAGRFGPGVLTETLRSELTGIDSLNGWLKLKAIGETFTTAFRDWMLASYINDTSKDRRLGYVDPDMRILRVSPQYRLTLSPGTESAVSTLIKNWQPVWYEFGVAVTTSPAKVFRLEASGPAGQNFILPYAVFYDDGSYDVFEAGPVNGIRRFYVVNPLPAGRGTKSVIKILLAATNATRPPGGIEENHTLSLKAAFANEEETLAALAAAPAAGLQPGALSDGALIKRNNSEPEMYVIEGKYKRYLRPEVIKLYGHLDPTKVILLDDAQFNSYVTANYVRNVNDEKVYAVWPDGTKHWLNMTGEYFTSSGRDWGAIFIINDLELNFYKTGADITR